MATVMLTGPGGPGQLDTQKPLKRLAAVFTVVVEVLVRNYFRMYEFTTVAVEMLCA